MEANKISLTDISYLAGLFDGEGCVQYKQRLDTKRKNRPNRYKVWRISLEMSMTDKGVMEWVYNLVKCGTLMQSPRCIWCSKTYMAVCPG